MQRDAHCELRVLSGTHAGARALVMQDTQIVGSDPGCDFVLSDEGVLARHARLELREDGSSVLSWLDGGLEPLVVRPGQGTRIGPVSIAIDAADAPWQQDVELVEALPLPTGPGTGGAPDGAAPGAGTDGVQEPLTGPQAVQDPQEAAQSAPAASRRADFHAGMKRHLQAALLTFGALAAVAVTGTVLWRGQAAPGPSPATAGARAGGAAASADITRLNALRAIIAELQLEDRVRIEAQAGQAPRVVAAWLTDEEAEMLAAALTRLPVRPRLQLESEPDTVARVQDYVLRQPSAGEQGLKASYLGQGRFRLEGRVAHEGARESLLTALAREFPLVRAVDSALVTQAEAAETMLADLKARGVGDIEGLWQDGALRLKVLLAQGEVQKWESVLQTVVDRHGLPFRADVVLGASPAAGTAAREAALPFTVRSIVSGDPSYVTLADGRRLVADGRADGWRLAEIGAKQLIFEGAGGRRVLVER